MSKLIVIVPRDRRSAGRGLLIGGDGHVKLGPFRVLATASSRLARANGNPSCDFRRPYGHTPAGSFVVAGALPPRTDRSARPDERLGALILAPASGNALEALRAGRTRFLLIGGPTDDEGRLRKTHGALRVASPDLSALFIAINDAHAAGDPLSSVEIEDVESPPWLVVETDAAPSSRALAPETARRALRPVVPKQVRKELGFLAQARPGRRAFVSLALLAMASLGFGCTIGPSGDQAGDGGSGGGREWPGDGGSSSSSNSSSSGDPVTADGGVTTWDEGTTEGGTTHHGGTEGGTGTDTTTGITTGGVTTGTGTDTTTNISTGTGTGTGTDTTTNVSTGIPTTGTDTTTNISTGTDGTTTGTEGTTTGTDGTGTGTDGTGTGTDGTGTGTDGTGTGTDGTGTGTDGTGTGTDGTGTGTDSFIRRHPRSTPRTPATGEGPGG